MITSKIIVAIELGTAFINGIVVTKKNNSMKSTIIAHESLESEGCVKHGVIYNIDEVAGKVKTIIKKMENTIDAKIDSCYMTISGKGLKAKNFTTSIIIDPDKPITLTQEKELYNRAKNDKDDFVETFDVFQPKYYIDEVESENSVVGRSGNKLTLDCTLIQGPRSLFVNPQKCIDKNDYKLKSYSIGPLASALLILTEEDTKKGCVLVDFGAGTTIASVFKDGILKDMVVIPFGGQSITKDIMSLGFNVREAENIKIENGSVSKKIGTTTKLPNNIDLKEVNNVIKCRLDEIILNLLDKLKEKEYWKDLKSGAILTGGASLLSGLVEYFESKSGLKTKIGIINDSHINNIGVLENSLKFSQILGTVLIANDDCTFVESIIEKPIPEPTIPMVEKVDIKEKTEKRVEDDQEIHKPEKKKMTASSSKKKVKQNKNSFFNIMQNAADMLFSSSDADEE